MAKRLTVRFTIRIKGAESLLQATGVPVFTDKCERHKRKAHGVDSCCPQVS